jgi:SsrA-binding protein
MKNKTGSGTIVNSQARRDYQFKQSYSAGMVLSGAETKSLRTHHGNLRGAFVNIKDEELWLFNATINPTSVNSNSLSPDTETRPRKLLVKKKELKELLAAKDQGLTIIPVKIITKGRFIKIEITTAKGLKKYDKRQKIKKRDTQRDVNHALKR